MDKIILSALCLILSAQSTWAVSFSDHFDVIQSAEFEYQLDGSPYTNTVIGMGNWEIALIPPVSIQSFDVRHSIFLFGEGVLDRIRVFGTAISDSEPTLTIDIEEELSFAGIAGSSTNETIFDLSGTLMNQGGITLISGFTTIDVIEFVGRYTDISEASSIILLLPCLLVILFRGRVCKLKSKYAPKIKTESSM